MEDQKKTETLFRKFLSKRCSVQEAEQVLEKLRSGDHLAIFESALEDVWSRLKEYPTLEEKHSRQLMSGIKGNLSSKVKPKQYWLTPLKVAATLALALTFAWLITTQTPFAITDKEPVAQMVVKEAPLGQKTTIRLSDGTLVKLNSGSRLTYPDNFDHDNREVNLEGEAFFEVEKDASRPFKITSGQVLTTVLGTSFNVHAFQNEDVRVTVLTGKVKVHSTDNPNSAVQLRPGDQALYEAVNGKLTSRQVNVEEHLVWKENIILFKGASQKKVLNTLSRWYDVSFEVKGDSTQEWGISGRYQDKSLEFILNSLSYSVGFSYEIKSNQIIINYNETQ